MSYTVYGLCDPAEKGGTVIRYVGMTGQSVRERVRQHVSAARHCDDRTDPVLVWIRSLLTADRYPCFLVLGVGMSKVLAFETDVIMSLRARGFDRLNQHANTGESRSDGYRAKLSANAAMRRPEVAAQRRGDRNPMKRPEVRAKISGVNNPAKRADVRAKMSANAAMRRPEVAAQRRGDRSPMKRPEVRAKHAAAMRDPAVKIKAWATRRANAAQRKGTAEPQSPAV